MPSPNSAVASHQSPLIAPKPFSFTLLSKNAPPNHLESHSCKNKGLKVPCFHTLTKNIGGRGVLFNLQPHTSNLCSSLTPLDSALASKRASKSFTSNTYEKHTQGEGGSLRVRTRITNHQFTQRPAARAEGSRVTAPLEYNLPHST